MNTPDPHDSPPDDGTEYPDGRTHVEQHNGADMFTPGQLIIDGATPLRDVRDIVARERWRGIDCPACSQYARVYLRRLNRSMAISLVKMYRAGSVGGPIHTPTVLRGNRGEEARLSYWGLTAPAAPPANAPDTTPRRGWWEVTRRGALWLLDGITVPAAAVIYNGTCLRLSGPPVGIHDALGDAGFSLRELLDTYAPIEPDTGNGDAA